jgi:hypothetical protein
MAALLALRILVLRPAGHGNLIAGGVFFAEGIRATRT